MSLQDEIRTLTQGYVRKGGKDNRHQQRGRMEKFADYCAEHGARSLGQIGKGQVIGYWKAHRHLAPRTLHAHWLALCELWRLAGKPGQPPRPRLDAQPAKTPEKGPEGPLPGEVSPSKPVSGFYGRQRGDLRGLGLELLELRVR